MIKTKNLKRNRISAGTWILNEERSYSKSKDRENISDYKVIITHIGEEIKNTSRSYIEKNNKNSYSEILYTDKRGEKNLRPRGSY